jgi:hypothetical protein
MRVWRKFLDWLLGCKWLLVAEYNYNGTRWRDFRCARCNKKMTLFADTPFRYSGIDRPADA